MDNLINNNIEVADIKKKSNKKVVIMSILLIIIFAILISFITLLIVDKNKEKSFKEELKGKLVLEDKTVEYGSQLNIKDLQLNNSKLYINDKQIDNFTFNEVGNVVFTEVLEETYKNFLGIDKNIIVDKKVTYKVEDTQAPIIEGVENKIITIGDSIDLKEGIIAKDVIDGDLGITTEGEVDTNNEGDYTITIKAVDKNGNETTKQFIVKVEAKQEVNKTTKKSNNNTNASQTNNSSNKNSSATYTWKDDEWQGEDTNQRSYILGGPNYYYYGGSVELTEEQVKQMVTSIIE